MTSGEGPEPVWFPRAMELTADPDIEIEEKQEGYVRYRRLSDGRRWEVHGVCDRRGDCMIGVTVQLGGSVIVRDHEHLALLAKVFGRERIDSVEDEPVTPEFDTCCGADIFTYVELPPA